MEIPQILDLAAGLIRYRSLSGEEQGVQAHLTSLFERLGWSCELLQVERDRHNLFVTFGEPRIVFTTHTDIVPAPDELFLPRIEDGVLYGRGACDAKGILATMIGVCARLAGRGDRGFGLLVVVGEEADGIGARAAAEQLEGRGIRYLINGEPTEGKLMRAHKGAVGFELRFSGRACHSGYPERGVDANRALVETAAAIMGADFGTDEVLGNATVNLGRIEGGAKDSIVAPRAAIHGLIRTVTQHESVMRTLESAVASRADLTINYDVPPVELHTVPGFEMDVASYCTDIPNFAALGAKPLLYGPGSIHHAHTDTEQISGLEVGEAVEGYMRIFEALR